MTQKHSATVQSPSLYDPSSVSSNRYDSEQTTATNIRQVIDVYKNAAERFGRVGEKEWREVIEQQQFVLEAVLTV